jgi:predicted dehydrogenase
MKTKTPRSSHVDPRPFHINRRSFLKEASVKAALAGLPAWFLQRELAWAQPADSRPSPNSRPGIALVGCGGMGTGDAQNSQRFGDLVAVCDVDQTHAEAVQKKFTREGKTPALLSDFRKVMERKDVDVVIVATPDHWHTLVNLAAAQAKKDVYCEKPLTLSIDEGKRLVKAVRDQGVVLQTGSQQRSEKLFRLACELVRNQRIGKLQQVTVYLPAGLRAGPFTSAPVPAGLNWDFWQGQAPKSDYVKERCHTTFRFWYDYSGGSMTDWGAHHNDIARWGVGLEGPSKIESEVLTQPIPGGYTTISEYVVTFTYGNGVRQVTRSTSDDSIFGGVVKKDGQRNGVKFEGTDGWIWVTRGDLDASKEDLIHTPLPDSASHLEVSGDHMGNFFDCVKSRKNPICAVEVGHRSASMCHLGAISLRLGRPLEWDVEKELFVGADAKAANLMVAREMRKPYDYSFIS